MTGLGRFGVTSTIKNPIWSHFSNEVERRLQVPSEWKNSYLVACALAYSSANRAKQEKTPNNLFTSISRAIVSESVVLDMPCVLKYIKACSRVEFRDIESLSVCANVLRNTSEFPAQIDTRELLELYTNLDKLGIDMIDVETELRNRKIQIPESKHKTWFPQSRMKKDKKSSLSISTDSLRKRKYSW